MASKSSSSSSAGAKNTPSPHEHVHQLVQDENAKTILLNVPLEASSGAAAAEAGSFKAPRRPGSSGQPSPRDPTAPVPSSATTTAASGSSRTRRVGGPPSRPGATPQSGGKSSSRRVRSASVGRDKKGDLQARYWAFLFENLRRAVDDIYNTCEADDSAPAAKEVVLVLENYVRDFKNLVDWFRLKYEYENTPPLKRPTSLAWEVRRTSPGGHKLTGQQPAAAAQQQQRLLMASPARRALNFEEKLQVKKEPSLQKVEEKSASVEKATAKAKAEEKKEPDFPAHKNSKVKEEVSSKESSDKAKSSKADEKENEAPVVKGSTTVAVKTSKVEKKVETSKESTSKSASAAGASSSKKETAEPDEKPASNSKKPVSKSSSSNTGQPQTKTGNQQNQTAKQSSSGSQTGAAKSTGVNVQMGCSRAQSTTTSAAAVVARGIASRPSSSPSPAVGKATGVAGKTTAAAVARTTSSTTATSSGKQSSLSSPDLRRGAAGSGKDQDKSSKPQRVSLVARQSLASSSQSTSSTSSSSTTGRTPLARAATTANISRTTSNRTSSKAGTLPAKQPLAKTSSAGSTRVSSSSASNEATTSRATATPVATSTSASSMPPFGSTSSVSSVGSTRSWADTVKGLRAPRSVENVASASTAGARPTSGTSDAATSAAAASTKKSSSVTDAEDADRDEGDGEWEAVRSRKRSRLSPFNRDFSGRRKTPGGSLGPSSAPQSSRSSVRGSAGGSGGSQKPALRKRDSLDSNLRSSYNAKARFNVPSSATSLPALALLEEEALTGGEESAGKKSTAPAKASSKEELSGRKLLHKSEEGRDKKSGHLDRVQEAAGETRSSSESLSDKSFKKKLAGAKATSITGAGSGKQRTTVRPGGRVSSSSTAAKTTAKKATASTPSSSATSNLSGATGKLSKATINRRRAAAEQEARRLEAESKEANDDADDEDNISGSDEASDDATDSAIAENEVAIARAEEEEEKLAREIRETEKQEMSETDGDPSAGEESDLQSIVSGGGDDGASMTNSCTSMSAAATVAAGTMTTPLKLDILLQDGPSAASAAAPAIPLSWADEIDLEEQLRAAGGGGGESRYPGRAIQLHEKLSSPARKKEPHEAFREHQEKQNQARMRREKFQDRKAAKLSALNAKIEEVIAQKEQLMMDQKELLKDKMRRAEEKRQQHIEEIRRKAHMEEAKLKEIAFINELQAQNSRIDMLAHNQTADERHGERLAELAEERARKVEERSAKEARAEERRRQMEEKRLQSMNALRERIRTREERIQEEQEQARKEREEAAREKARDREEKLSSVRAAEEDLKTELQEKIQQKQEDAAKRHREKLERIRHKAFELSVLRCSAAEGSEDGEGGAGKDANNDVPKLRAYQPKKKCDLCDALIANEVQLQSHLKGRRHRERVAQANGGRKLSGEELRSCNLLHVVDMREDDAQAAKGSAEARERNRAMKRRAKKVRNRMAARAAEYERERLVMPAKFDSPNRAKIGKALKEIEKVFGSQGRGAWPNNAVASLERAMGEICRAFEKNQAQDKVSFFALNGFNTLARVFHLLQDQKSSCCIPMKSIVTCCRTWRLACAGHADNVVYALKYNHLTNLADILMDRLLVLVPEKDEQDMASDDYDSPEGQDGPLTDPVAKAIMGLLAQTFEDLSVVMKEEAEKQQQKETNQNGNVGGHSDPADTVARTQDQISYVVSLGVMDRLAAYLQGVQDPIDGKPEVGDMLFGCLTFMSSLAGAARTLKTISGNSSNGDDPTYMLQAYKATELAGLVSMLYGLLLHQGAPARDSSSNGNNNNGGDSSSSCPPSLPPYVMAVALAASGLLLRLARQDLQMVQGVLAQEGISLEFRHIASYLLWHCGQQQEHQQQNKGSGNNSRSPAVELLHLTIILVGYFAAKHEENQSILQSGHQPSVLQQLCSLPFPYFSQPDLRAVLFPTLIAACHDNGGNRDILGEEVSYALLQEFMDSPEGREDQLVKVVLSGDDNNGNEEKKG